MPINLQAIVGSVTPPGRLLSATRWLLDNAQRSDPGVDVQLVNLADQRIAFADGRPPEQYGDDTAKLVEGVRHADGVVLASPVYRGSITGALKNFLDHVPLEALAAKPVGIIAMGATHHHFLGADWHLRDVLAWFGAIVVPTSVYLVSADFTAGELVESARQDLNDLAAAVIKLSALTPEPGKYLGPKPLAGRRN